MSKKLKGAMLFRNGMIACFDEQGEQVGPLQGSLLAVWAERATTLGYDVNNLIVEANEQSWRIIKTADGWNIEPV